MPPRDLDSNCTIVTDGGMSEKALSEWKTSIFRVTETAPPTVSSELHLERANPYENKKEKEMVTSSIEESIAKVTYDWEAGKEAIETGTSRELVAK